MTTDLAYKQIYIYISVKTATNTSHITKFQHPAVKIIKNSRVQRLPVPKAQVSSWDLPNPHNFELIFKLQKFKAPKSNSSLQSFRQIATQVFIPAKTLNNRVSKTKKIKDQGFEIYLSSRSIFTRDLPTYIDRSITYTLDVPRA